MTYTPKLAAALSGATLHQLARWRRSGPGGAVLAPEWSARRPILYSFRDVLAARTYVWLRRRVPLRRISAALGALPEDPEPASLPACWLLVDGESVQLVRTAGAADPPRPGGQRAAHALADVIRPFSTGDRQVPDLLQPRPHLSVHPLMRGGEPVIAGTRITYEEVAMHLRAGMTYDSFKEFYYPWVSAEAASDAVDFAEYVDAHDAPRAA